MAFRQVVHDAVDEWEEQLHLKVENYSGENDPGSDIFRTEVLRTLHDILCVSFVDWVLDEVLVFAYIAYDRNELVKLTKEGKSSQFFALLHKYWFPSAIEWMHFLWRFSGPSHQFFADLLVSLPSGQRQRRDELGAILFDHMVSRRIWLEASLPSIVGVLVRRPNELTRVKDHAIDIRSLSKRLSPHSAGLVCRSLLIYRARERSNTCVCGYELRQPCCTCADRSKNSRPKDRHGFDLSGDLDKEYARALISYTLTHFEDEWHQESQEEFIRTTCDYVFSEQIYTELFQHLRQGQHPTKLQSHPRPLTDFERRNNILRVEDGDYDRGFAQHAGCVQPNCKQAAKEGCENTCCNTHCLRLATKSCWKHKVFLEDDYTENNPRSKKRRKRRW